MGSVVIRAYIKRHVLLTGFFAVLLPLGILLAMQYIWLARLEQTTAIAERSALGNYLEAISNEVTHFYWRLSERALNIPSDLFRDAELEQASHYLKKKQVEGAKYLFVVSYTQHGWGKLVLFDPRSGQFDPVMERSTERAIHVALAPWKTVAYQGASLQAHETSVNENDPSNRIILNPITQDENKLVGVAGLIVDNEYFNDEVLPAAIEKSLPQFCAERGKSNLYVSVHDSWENLVYGEEIGEAATAQVLRRMPFVFKDWELSLSSRYDTPEQLAKSNFVVNLSLVAILAVVLLGGIVLALRTASREMRLSKMKSDFVSNVSHELRTPLASIRVFGEFLRLGRVDDENKIREYGEYIETESRRLTALISNILDFSKIESGAKTYRFEMADLEALLKEILGTLEVSLRHKGFTFAFEVQAEQIPELEIDTEAIAQAVSNLVDNAAKYSDGSRIIGVILRKTESWIEIAVRDQGIGISRSQQKKIFERFHRVGSGLIHDVKGSGLGLSIVHHIIEAHGGKITVQSEPGKGSTFVMHLPFSEEVEKSPDEFAAEATG